MELDKEVDKEVDQQLSSSMTSGSLTTTVTTSTTGGEAAAVELPAELQQQLQEQHLVSFSSGSLEAAIKGIGPSKRKCRRLGEGSFGVVYGCRRLDLQQCSSSSDSSSSSGSSGGSSSVTSGSRDCRRAWQAQGVNGAACDGHHSAGTRRAQCGQQQCGSG